MLANAVALPLFVVFVVLVIGAHALIWGSAELQAVVANAFGPWWLATIVVFLGSVVVHEGLHGIGMLRARVPRADIRFGIHWKALAPYASTRAPMTVAQYRFVTALPGLVLGIVPAVIGIATGNALITVYGAALTGAASGDALVFWAVRHLPPDTIVQDCPSNIGCEVVAESLSR